MTRSEIDSAVERPIGGYEVERFRPPVKLRMCYRRRRLESGLGGKLPVRKGMNPAWG